MSKPATVIAAGGVVWRDRRGTREVLLVHRPRYDDWSLPKGKLAGGEHVLVAARREIEEETGHRVLLGPPLGVQRYDVRKNGSTVPKLVHYWSAEVTTGADDEPRFEPNDEIDRLEWLTVDKAARRLSYPRDVTILDQLDAVTPVESSLVLLRHTEAVKRKEWDGKDTVRPLTRTGRATAERLVDVLGALGVNRVLSSDAERCATTVAPYAAALGRRIHLHPEISERGFEADPTALNGLCRQVWKPGRVTVVCSHRPVLPALARELGLPVGKYSPGSFVVAHRLADGGLVHERFSAP
ncbi:NUDIX hydrolase [Kribbella flavida DSM 17836]|uniref:NUDIX hydrolase n=1 Tax=Kribbella flavida (strain DSM 17836 / JCM 10339 / NBRC 14399) TaxID=479435 RepID=D2Q182_KRIFD|nr:NUDIX hydrolase [Kribbella flavida]ADB30070.1 NUDIX hydrolase [Kribbella flavida DSM 17836]